LRCLGFGQICQQRFQVIRRKRLEADRHDGHSHALQTGNIFALNDMFLSRGIENLDRGLGFSFQSAGIGFAILRSDIPELVIGFDGTIRIKNL
jgi:hypothetical protein